FHYVKLRPVQNGTLRIVEVVAAIIVNAAGKVLAVKCPEHKNNGGWEFPGGKIEAGESRESAIVREIREELNVGIRVERKVCTVEYDYPQFHLRMHCLWCSMADGVLELKEHQEARWLEPMEWESVNWLPADVEVVKRLG
ncbi:MAG: (deoxy)nucleoside triphosphate pyrophosphohydrolase, partial [Bacteroidaceae bacterium]|nr:(deoxy)nucleoside triphosphate pyrophosphohydrolase [Bacteroidaceae bacterium]